LHFPWTVKPPGGEGTVEWVEEDGKSGGMRFTEVSPEFSRDARRMANSDVRIRRGAKSHLMPPLRSTPWKIRQECAPVTRSGPPTRRRRRRVPEQKSEPRIFLHVAQKNVSGKAALTTFPNK